MHDLPLRTSLVVTADAAASRSARVAVHDLCLHAALGTDTTDVAQLLVAELVSNAHEHGRGPAFLDAVVDARRLRVAVADDNPALPTPREAAVDDERGRGLMLVEALASRWGAARADRGKSVWFELDRA